MHPLEAFKVRFLGLLKESGLQDSEFIAKAKVSETTLRNWKMGETIPQVETLIKLCRFFNVSMDYLCGLSEEK